MDASHVGGLEIGGTWLRAISLDDDGALRSAARAPTPAEPAAGIATLTRLWAEVGSPSRVGIASAPVLDPDGVVMRWPTRPMWRGARLRDAVPRARVLVELDDGSAAAVAEHLAATCDLVLPSTTVYVCVGTGVGGGIVIDDRLHSGRSGQAMDLGHVPVAAAAGIACACGSTGCVQAVARGALLDASTAPSATGRATAARAIAEAIAITCRIADPDRVIVGGGALEGSDLFDRVLAQLRETLPELPLERARTGPFAGAHGAAIETARALGVRIRSAVQRDGEGARIAIVHGPNMGLLGTREPDIYGTATLVDVERALERLAGELGCRLYHVQSDHEGALVEWIRTRGPRLDGIVLNPAGLTGTGHALRDVLLAVKVPFVEVHLSNIDAREELHRSSCFADVASGRVSGLGAQGYELGLRALVHATTSRSRRAHGARPDDAVPKHSSELSNERA